MTANGALWVPPHVEAEREQERLRSQATGVTTVLRRAEMQLLEDLHTIAQKYNFVVACERCRRPFVGHNTDFGVKGAIRSIACACRELRG